jgi:anti-sigma B factor antagonist
MAVSHLPGHVTVRADQVTDTVVVHVSGEIDLATATPLRDALEHAAADPTVRILVCDLSRVTFLACNGLTMLLSARSALAERGGELRVVATEPIVLRLFALTGLAEKLGVQSHATALHPV